MEDRKDRLSKLIEIRLKQYRLFYSKFRNNQIRGGADNVIVMPKGVWITNETLKNINKQSDSKNFNINDVKLFKELFNKLNPDLENTTFTIKHNEDVHVFNQLVMLEDEMNFNTDDISVIHTGNYHVTLSMMTSEFVVTSSSEKNISQQKKELFLSLFEEFKNNKISEENLFTLIVLSEKINADFVLKHEQDPELIEILTKEYSEFNSPEVEEEPEVEQEKIDDDLSEKYWNSDFEITNPRETIQPEEEGEDCTNSDLFFENRADGNCLFDSIAQLYYPYDIRKNKNLFEEKIPNLSAVFRVLISKIYEIASKNDNFRKQLEISSKITGIDNNTKTLSEYSEFILKNKEWATDDELRVIAKLIGIPIRIIENTNNLVRKIDPDAFDVFSDEDYYTFCNIDNKHWVLKKGGNYRDVKNDIESIKKRVKLFLYVSKNKEKSKPSNVEIPKEPVYTPPENNTQKTKQWWEDKFQRPTGQYQQEVKKEPYTPLKTAENVEFTAPKLSDVTAKPFIQKMFKTVPKTMVREQEAWEGAQEDVTREKTKAGIGIGPILSNDEIAQLNKRIAELEKQLADAQKSVLEPAKNWIFTYLFSIFKHFPMFGFIADIINNDFRYSIPSLIGILSVIVNSFIGLIAKSFLNFNGQTPLECSVPGFSFLDSIISPQGIVLPISIFTYLFIDFGLNRSPNQNLGTAIIFAIFLAIHVLVMIVNDCFRSYYGGLYSLLFATIIGFLLGLSGWIGVLAIAPDRFPSHISSEKPVASVVKSAPAVGVGKCSNPNNQNQITCEDS